MYELKLDGYRALIIKDGERVQICSRNDKDLTRMYPRLALGAQKLKVEKVVLDGEIVALDAQGRPSFQTLQHRSSKHSIVFYAFDVLHVNGRDVIAEPLTTRRSRMSALIGESTTVRLSQALPGRAQKVVAAVRAAGLEGVIAKRKDSVYQPGARSPDWVKLKLECQQEFVIGGYRPDGSAGIEALLVGYYDGQDLRFAGKVRAGLVPYVRRELRNKLSPLEIKECSFVNLPDAAASRWGSGITVGQMAQMRWTRPKLVAQIRFLEWTAERRLRHASFLGLRHDKHAQEVHREM